MKINHLEAKQKMGDLVIAPQVIACETAIEVLRQGGNAFDAAVAGSFAQGVIDPQMCSIGGFGVALIYEADIKRTVCLSFHSRAGSKVTPDIWADLMIKEAPDGFGFFLRGAVNDIGA